MQNFQYAYLIGNLFFLTVWVILFLYRRDLRRKMLIMSLVIAPMGPISQLFYLRDYWQPQLFNGWLIGIEVRFTFRFRYRRNRGGHIRRTFW